MRQPRQSQTNRPAFFPAPTRGWVENENIAASSGGAARVLDNWYPRSQDVRLRGGALKAATVGSDPVVRLISYQGSTPKLWATTADSLYDISGLDPVNPPSAEFGSMTNGEWHYQQITTSGGGFILAFNGADDGRLYTASTDTWAAINAASTPAITGVATAEIIHVWMHAQRIWMIEENSLSAWYLPVDSIGGAATQFALGSVFLNGGSLSFGFSWSADSGDGMADRCVFVSDRGEAVVYEGTNPGSTATWALVGRYEVGEPVSKETIRTGGDVLIPTKLGLVPISLAVSKTAEELSMAAISFPINVSWARAVSTQGDTDFRMIRWDQEGMGIVGLPHRDETFVVNLQTMAWARYTGWDVQCLGRFGDQAYFGDSAGSIFQVEGGGSDDGELYTGRLQYFPDQLGMPGAMKSMRSAMAVFSSLYDVRSKLSARADYSTDFPTAPPAAMIDDAAGIDGVWDVGEWDVMSWDVSSLSEDTTPQNTRWQSINRTGIEISPQVQVSSGSTRRPNLALIAVHASVVPGRAEG